MLLSKSMPVTPTLPSLDMATLLSRDPYLGPHQGEIKRRKVDWRTLLLATRHLVLK